MCLARSVWISIAIFAASGYAQPFIFYRGIVNAASYAPPGLPNGSIARGSIFSVFGRNFGPDQAAQASQFPLATTLAGAGISVCQSGACVPAIPVFVNASQINAIMPSNAPLGPVSLRVVFNGQGGYYASATVVASSFGIFTVNGAGFGPGSVQNFMTDGSLTLNAASAPARPGQTVVLWGTGLGAGLNADNVAPQAGDLPVDIEIWTGGKPVRIKRYSGRSPCCAGLDQIVFDLPPDTPLGCYVPVQVRTGGMMVSNSASIAVSADGSPCSDSFNPLSRMYRDGGRIGLIFGNRFNVQLSGQDSQPEHTVEFVLASFRRETPAPFAYNALTSLPPPGSCTVHAVSGDFFGGTPLAAFRATAAELNAGTTLTVGETKAGRSSYYSTMLAGTLESLRRRNLPATVFDSPVRVEGAGGPDVPPFTLDLPAVPAIRWTDRGSGRVVLRDGGFTLNWEGADAPGNVFVVAGVNVDVPRNASAVFLCTALPGTRSFGIPPYVLQALPASVGAPSGEFRFGYAMAGVLPLGSAMPGAPSGLDAVAVLTAAWSARAVVYK
jgi:uncharacterized protein (TIGR03437 family)